MSDAPRHVRVKVGFPWVVSVETDDVLSLFRRRRESGGPFLLIVRGRGLALDTAFGMENDSPVLFPPHALAHQLWYFHRTEYRDQVQIVSVASGLALDAQTGREVPRDAVMWTRHGQSHQRWRLRPTDDGAACFIESIRTGHVLDVPWEADLESRTAPVLYDMHGGENQQFVIATPSSSEFQS